MSSRRAATRVTVFLLSAGILSWAVTFPAVSSLAADVPEEVRRAAEGGLPGFLALIPPGDLLHYGFRGPQEFSHTSLGVPFLIHTLMPSEILAYTEGRLDELSIHPTKLWQFPVMCDGTPRTLLTIDRMGDRWEAVDIGGFSPAAEMAEAVSHWPSTQGYELAYVLVFQTGSQFIAVTEQDVTFLVPLETTARALGIIEVEDTFGYRLMGMPEVASILAPFLRASLETLDD